MSKTPLEHLREAYDEQTQRAVEGAKLFSEKYLECEQLKRDRAELISVIDDLLMALALPGQHCETEQTTARAIALLDRLKVKP